MIEYDIYELWNWCCNDCRLQWVPEITHHCQKTPFLLVGTQIDLRDDAATVDKLAKNKQRVITIDQGEKLARELKAVKYVECSALTQVRLFDSETIVNWESAGILDLSS